MESGSKKNNEKNADELSEEAVALVTQQGYSVTEAAKNSEVCEVI